MTHAARERLQALQAVPLDGGLEVFEARTFKERRVGLAKLDELPPDWGLRIYKCWAVHTFGMRFSLDLLWLDKDGSCVRVDRDVPPRRQRVCLSARSVIEVNAGEADRFLAAGVPRSV